VGGLWRATSLSATCTCLYRRRDPHSLLVSAIRPSPLNHFIRIVLQARTTLHLLLAAHCLFQSSLAGGASSHWRQPRRGCRGHVPPNILVGGTSTGISPPILLRTFGYSRAILVAVRSLSLKPISFGYKTSPVRFSQAGGQSAHKARPPNLELALTPLLVLTAATGDERVEVRSPIYQISYDNLAIILRQCQSYDRPIRRTSNVQNILRYDTIRDAILTCARKPT